MSFLVILFFSFILIFIYFYLLKNTIFGISLKTGNYLGFFIFYDLMMFIIPSSILLNLFPIKDFWVAFKVQQERVFWIAFIILISMLMFFITLKAISFISKKYLFLGLYEKNINSKNIKYFVRISIITCLLAIVFAWIVFGVGHSFSSSIINDISVSILRAEIKQNSSVKALKHLFILIVPFLTAIIASNVYKNSLIERVIMFFSILFIASWGGSKAPLLSMFIVFIVSYSTFNNLKINLKLFFKFLIGICIFMYIVYQVVLLQYSHMTDISLFFDYFFQRVFVAQMIGTYEQFNLWIKDFSYIWHGIPFASSFVDYPIFQKDLMMISEDRIDPNSIGIKNTFFIAEAYAMGGWFLVFLSPIWIAINLSLSYVFIVFLMNKFVFNNIEYTKRIVALALFSYISVTGGFSDLMFFKITIMILILISPFLLTFYFLKSISIKKLK